MEAFIYLYPNVYRDTRTFAKAHTVYVFVGLCTRPPYNSDSAYISLTKQLMNGTWMLIRGLSDAYFIGTERASERCERLTFILIVYMAKCNTDAFDCMDAAGGDCG